MVALQSVCWAHSVLGLAPGNKGVNARVLVKSLDVTDVFQYVLQWTEELPHLPSQPLSVYPGWIVCTLG